MIIVKYLFPCHYTRPLTKGEKLKLDRNCYKALAIYDGLTSEIKQPFQVYLTFASNCFCRLTIQTDPLSHFAQAGADK